MNSIHSLSIFQSMQSNMSYLISDDTAVCTSIKYNNTLFKGGVEKK